MASLLIDNNNNTTTTTTTTTTTNTNQNNNNVNTINNLIDNSNDHLSITNILSDFEELPGDLQICISRYFNDDTLSMINMFAKTSTTFLEYIVCCYIYIIYYILSNICIWIYSFKCDHI